MPSPRGHLACFEVPGTRAFFFGPSSWLPLLLGGLLCERTTFLFLLLKPLSDDRSSNWVVVVVGGGAALGDHSPINRIRRKYKKKGGWDALVVIYRSLIAREAVDAR